jgi:hypothetical protein
VASKGAVALRFFRIVPSGEVLVITGSQDGAAPGGGHLRAAHADREHVIDLLKAAFVEGRLSKDELGARAGQALTARTYAELAAVTADIPAGLPAARRPRQPARPRNGPARTLGARNAAIASVGSMVGAVLFFGYGVHLDDHKTLTCLGLAFFAFVVGLMFAVGAIVELRRSRRQLPPRPGQGGQPPARQRHGSAGHDASRPGPRADQNRADLRLHRPRPDRPRPRVRSIPVARGTTPTPTAA